MSSDYEKLFLIEILVNSVEISKDKLNLDPSVKSRLGETCVMFQFLNYQPLVVCEQDIIKQTQQSNINFNHGKSCLFSIRSSVCPTLPGTLDVVVSVMMNVNSPEGNQQITVGTVKIPMGESFTSLIRSSEANKDNVPGSKTKAGTYALLDNDSNQIGQIAVFLRLSCFGQMIVTQIQLGGDSKSTFMFKGTDYDKVYEYPADESKKPVLVRDTTKPSFSEQQSFPAQVSETVQGIKTEPSQPYPDQYPSQFGSYQEDMAFDGYGDPSREVMTKYYDQPLPSEAETAETAPSTKKKGHYKEIIAEIRGHALKIRVPRKEKKKECEETKYYSCQQIEELQRELQGGSNQPESRCQCACMRQ